MSGEANQVKWRGVRPIAGIRGVWPEIDSVRVQETAYASNQGTTIIYTVPANKILFVATDLMTSLLIAAAATNGRMGVRNAADVHVYFMQYHYYSQAGQQSTFLQHLPALEVPALYDVYVTSGNANISVRGMIFGWLEDA